MSCSSKGCSGCEVSESRGCGVSSVFDWLYQIDNPKNNNSKLVEVQFKGDRKGFYENTSQINIKHGDFVTVEGDKAGHDIGKITMIGDLVAVQMNRKKRDIQKEPLKKIYRISSKKDKEKWKLAVANEQNTLEKAKRIIEDFKLEMKLSDIEFQADNSKATFYYTAEQRVDFRGLIREYSREFGVKIEMRHIGARQESAKIGGVGSCGRELCCSTWMTTFPSVSTSAARYQQLSINPQKISGQCGRLKCCLNFELDGYMELLNNFPDSNTPLKTKKGLAKFVKLDVFKGVMFYFNTEEPTSELLEINMRSAAKLIDLNKKGTVPESFDDFVVEKPIRDTMFLETTDSITRFDNKKKKRRFKKKK